VGSRERKRAERRKRKARGHERIKSGYAKAEEKNREAREALHPLYEGERPTVVTVGAVFSALVALIFWISTAIALFTDTTVDGRDPHPLQLALTAAVVTAMAWGMWKARYWAVLGFQVVLVIFLLLGIAGLVGATTIPQVIGTLLLVAVCLTFFLFMVKAMARIQMPERLHRE
jgi:ABC-type multidrug transport system permease subunit